MPNCAIPAGPALMPVPSTLSYVLDPPSLATPLALRCFQAGEERGPLMLACTVPCHHQQPRVATRVLLLHKEVELLTGIDGASSRPKARSHRGGPTLKRAGSSCLSIMISLAEPKPHLLPELEERRT